MLVDFEALLALVAGDELDLGVRQALCRQVGQHLVPEQVGMNRLGDARLVAVVLHDLLHAARGERRAALGLEQITVLRIGLQVAAQDQAKALGEEDVAVFAPLAQPVLRALALVKKYADSKVLCYPADEEVPLEGVVRDSWQEAVVERDKDGNARVNRISYEICALQALRERLRCKEVWVRGRQPLPQPRRGLARRLR